MAMGPLDWLAEFHRVVTDGRQLGIHVVLAVDRRQAVPALMMSSIGLRLVMRQTDEQGYGDFGIPLVIEPGPRAAQPVVDCGTTSSSRSDSSVTIRRRRARARRSPSTPAAWRQACRPS